MVQLMAFSCEKTTLLVSFSLMLLLEGQWQLVSGQPGKLDEYIEVSLIQEWLNLYLTAVNISSVVMTKNISNPIRLIGSNVTLTCTATVEFRSIYFFLEDIHISWTGPAGVILSTTAPVIESYVIHTTMCEVTTNSYGRIKSNCECNCCSTIRHHSIIWVDSSHTGVVSKLISSK